MDASAFTNDEAGSVQSLLDAMSARAGFRQTIQRLIDRWNGVVARLERGYDLTVYDYENDLSIRDLLQELIDHGSPALAAKIMAILSPADARFFELTTEAHVPIREDTNRKARPWWTRVPLKMTLQLENDLRGRGFIH